MTLSLQDERKSLSRGLDEDRTFRAAVLDYLQARCALERATGFGGSAHDTQVALLTVERASSALGAALYDDWKHEP